MFQNFKGKIKKDTETAAETYIDSLSFSNEIIKKTAQNLDSSISAQQLSDDNFNILPDKRNNG